jgi:hypothetical protein
VLILQNVSLHLKSSPRTVTCCCIRMKSEAGPPPCNRLSLWGQSGIPLFLGRCSRELRRSCAGAKMVYSRTELAFILGHYFASKSFAAVPEAFTNVFHYKEVPNKTTDQMVTFQCIPFFEKVVDIFTCYMPHSSYSPCILSA